MPQFSDLPPELRHYIWETTLPEITEAIYIFNWSWAEQFLTQRDEPIRVSPRPCMPARVQVPIPEAYMVCREARAVVEKWMKKNRIEWYFRHETQGHILIRGYDVQRDILYVPRDDWVAFWGYTMDDSTDTEGQKRIRENLVNIALPAYSAFDSILDMREILSLSPNVKEIFVIWNDLPRPHKILYRVDNQDCEVDAPVQPRWEIASFLKLGETVHMHKLDKNDRLNASGKGVLRDWVQKMDRKWRAVVHNTDLVDEHTGDLKVPRINVTVMKMPTWNYKA